MGTEDEIETRTKSQGEIMAESCSEVKVAEHSESG